MSKTSMLRRRVAPSRSMRSSVGSVIDASGYEPPPAGLSGSRKEEVYGRLLGLQDADLNRLKNKDVI